LREGNSTCMSCGLVIESHTIDFTEECNLYSSNGSDVDKRRVGATFDDLFKDGGMSLIILGDLVTKASTRFAQMSSVE